MFGVIALDRHDAGGLDDDVDTFECRCDGWRVRKVGFPRFDAAFEIGRQFSI